MMKNVIVTSIILMTLIGGVGVQSYTTEEFADLECTIIEDDFRYLPSPTAWDPGKVIKPKKPAKG